MGKNPAFMYYPKDWQSDAVFGCSLAARGLWHEMMNVMHFCEPYGYLAENGKPMTDERIARRCGTTLPEYVSLLGELDAAGIPRRTTRGFIYSKRMVADARERSEWRKRQKKHRDTVKPVTPCVTNMSRLSASASSSASAKIKPHTQATAPFEPPTQQEVFGYMVSRGLPNAEVEAQNFMDHHAQRHWKVSGGRGPLMSDWRMAVRTWQSYKPKFRGKNGAGKTTGQRKTDVSKAAISRVFGFTGDVAPNIQPALPSGDRGIGGDGVPGDAENLHSRAD